MCCGLSVIYATAVLPRTVLVTEDRLQICVEDFRTTLDAKKAGGKVRALDDPRIFGSFEVSCISEGVARRFVSP